MTELFASPLRWLPWVGGIVVLGVVGSVLGVTGVFGHPVEKVTVAVDSILMPPTVNATSCPDGPVVASVERGSRVVALARNADGTQVQVRNPQNVSQLVWVPTSQVDADSGQAVVSTLPAGAACPTLFVAQAPVVVAPVIPVTPTKPTKPGTPAVPDTTKPVVLSLSKSGSDDCHPVITAQVTDNVGVTSVTLKWTDFSTHTISMNHASGSTWTVPITVPDGDGGTVSLSAAGRDAAGNVGIGTSSFTGACPIG